MTVASNARREPAKPVKLQLNNSGAWKNVVSFDAGDDLVLMHVLDAANTLGSLDYGGMTFRVVNEAQPPMVLKYWTKQDGWKDARHAK